MHIIKNIGEGMKSREELQGFLRKLETGTIRAAYPDTTGTWHANEDVKEGILEVMKNSQTTAISDWPGFVDKELLTPRKIREEDNVRFVPGGSTVRAGVFLAQKVTIMPPSYINVGAYIDEGTLVDSHVLIGSCAQIGKNIHLSTGVKIAGVLEPVSAHPVIVEDDVFLGAGVYVLEGLRIRKGAVLAPGVRVSKSIEIIDLVHEKILPKGADIPENAVVIPGTKPVSSEWGQSHKLAKQCALIVKYRDRKTSAAVELEAALR
jgi:2,3,4,5-tetrahydropyridine-2-carboxylate N-succinyltransferase